MKNKLIVANWKANKNIEEAQQWVEDFAGLQRPSNRHYVVCPAYPLIPFLLDLTEQGVDLGVQDISPFGAGAYTGEVAPFNLQLLGIKYAIVGHSERRRYFNETSNTVAQKVTQALDFDITPIICVDRDQIDEQASRIAAIALRVISIGS